MAKCFDELTYRDDFIFGKTMEDLDLCHDVLECLLQKPIGKLEAVEPQKEFRDTYDGKKIRLDIYAQSGNSIYDTEMQNKNHDSLTSLQLAKRSRFYLSAIDMDFLEKSDSYRSLPEANIVFVCTFDPFQRDNWCYPFHSICSIDPSLSLNDSANRYFFNTTYKGTDIPNDVRELFHYIQTGEVVNSLTARINDSVERVKSNEKWRSEYMKERALFMDLREEGRADGFKKGQLETLLKLVRDGILTVEAAAAYLNRSPEEFLKLSAELNDLKN